MVYDLPLLVPLEGGSVPAPDADCGRRFVFPIGKSELTVPASRAVRGGTRPEAA